MSRAKKIKAELEKVRRKCGGTVPAQAVVDFARNSKTALHSRFTWNNTKAAELYRLEQARRIIRVYANILTEDRPDLVVRDYVRLPSDTPETGYRLTVDVMDDADQRMELLDTVMKELRRLRRKHYALSELASVWEAIDAVQVKV